MIRNAPLFEYDPSIASGLSLERVSSTKPVGEPRIASSLNSLHHLIIDEKVPAENIVVLTPRAVNKSLLWKMGSLGNFRLVDQPTGASGEVFSTTIHQFKGLESPVIIMAEIEPEYAPDIEKLLYIGGSRACNHLIVLAHDKLFL